MKKIFNLSLLLLLVLPSAVSAVGVAVYPAEVSIEAAIGEQTTTRLKVSNPSSDVAVFEVYPDEFDQLIKISPSSFTLESSEERQVIITVTPRESGRLHTAISVVGRPMASSAFQAGSGAKVPFTINSINSASGFALAIENVNSGAWAVFVVGLGLVFIVAKRRKS